MPVRASEFLGARKRLMPRTKEGKAVIDSRGVAWREPPFLHEQTLIAAWVRSVEEMAQGGILNQHLRDVCILFCWIQGNQDGFWEPMRVEDWERRKTNPPFLSEAGKVFMSLQLSRLSDLKVWKSDEAGKVVLALLERDLDILRQVGIFRLSEGGMNLVKENITKELKEKTG